MRRPSVGCVCCPMSLVAHGSHQQRYARDCFIDHVTILGHFPGLACMDLGWMCIHWCAIMMQCVLCSNPESLYALGGSWALLSAAAAGTPRE